MVSYKGGVNSCYRYYGDRELRFTLTPLLDITDDELSVCPIPSLNRPTSMEGKPSELSSHMVQLRTINGYFDINMGKWISFAS